MDYVDPFETLTLDIAYVQGVQINLFWEAGTIPFIGETWGVNGDYTPSGVGVVLSYLCTTFWHELKIQ